MTTYYTKSRLKHNGKVFEIGDEVEISESAAKRLVEQGVLSTSKVEVPEPDDGGPETDGESSGENEGAEDGDNYDELKSKDLKALLRERELPVGGKIDDLRERLRADDAADDDESDDSDEGDDVADDL